MSQFASKIRFFQYAALFRPHAVERLHDEG